MVASFHGLGNVTKFACLCVCLQAPFRDSKLTKILIDSLGGRARTMMISCLSSASGAMAETVRTLQFRYSTLPCGALGQVDDSDI